MNWTLEEKTLVPELRKPFDVLARGLVGPGREDGEGKGTPLELFTDGVVGFQPQVRKLIREAARSQSERPCRIPQGPWHAGPPPTTHAGAWAQELAKGSLWQHGYEVRRTMNDRESAGAQHLWRFVRGDTTPLDFEEWVYGAPQLEERLGPALYLEVISTDFADKEAVWSLRRAIGRYLRSLTGPDCMCIRLQDLGECTVASVLSRPSERADALVKRELTGSELS